MVQICIVGNFHMFAFVRFLLLAVIVLAIVLFMQPNLLEKLGLQLPVEETSVTTGDGMPPEADEASVVIEAEQETQKETVPETGTEPVVEPPAIPEPAVTETPPLPGEVLPAKPATIPGEDEAELPAAPLPVEEPGAAPGEPASGDETLQQAQPLPEPASDTPVGEAMTDMTDNMENGPRPAEAGSEELPATQPEADGLELLPVPDSPPVPAEEKALPAVDPATWEVPAAPADPVEEPGRDAEEMIDSPLEDLQEPRGEQPQETTGKAPAETGGEADEIPTAGSPELQRVLENIDRTFNN
jgi:hypothetical protein